MTKKVHVKIPATSANMGSGFDAVGIALTLYNEILFEERPGADAITIEIKGMGQNEIPTDPAENLVSEAMAYVAKRNGQPLPAGHLTLINRIPPARGLGSSSAALVGGIMAGDALTGRKLTKEDILIIANSMEGHPDNVAPATYGGLTSSIIVHDKAITNSVPVEDDLSFITVSPEIEVSTEEARQALPDMIDYKSAVFNVSRVSFLLSSFFTKRYDYLKYSLQDKLHVPYRIQLIPHGQDVLDAAITAGALGSTISGSGSTLIAFATGREREIEEAMISTFAGYGIQSFGHILKADNQGATYVDISE